MKRPTIIRTLPTPRGRDVLQAIADHHREHGGATPTQRALAKRLDLPQSSISAHVKRLAASGYLKHGHGLTASLRFTPAALKLFENCPCCGRPFEENDDSNPQRNARSDA
ncbi:MAG: helix-turn-helix domain-containing protein [Planctomycetota bacterium]